MTAGPIESARPEAPAVARPVDPGDVVRTPAGEAAFVLTRTASGWTVLTPAGVDECRGLVEAMSLADLVAEDQGADPEPDRQARRAARASVAGPPPEQADPRDAELVALRRTVEQLEHALATRVSTERAIGVLAERHQVTPRSAFEELRRQARSSGRPVHDLAREVLAGLVAAPGRAEHCPSAGGATDVPRSPGAAAAAAKPGPAAPRFRTDRVRRREPAAGVRAEGER